LIGSSDNSIYVFDIVKMQLIEKIENAHQNSVFSIENINGVIVSGGRDARLNTWTYPAFEPKNSQEAHWYTINDLLYIESFDALITASRDKSIRLWDAGSLQPLHTLGLQQGGHMNSVNTLLFDEKNQFLYSAGDDRSIIRYTIE
jgi:WD40 repeat protein